MNQDIKPDDYAIKRLKALYPGACQINYDRNRPEVILFWPTHAEIHAGEVSINDDGRLRELVKARLLGAQS